MSAMLFCRYKKVVSVPNWDKQAKQTRFQGDDEQWLESQREQLDLQDVDPGECIAYDCALYY